jgi:REP element-mobilizing transposase RayT
MSRPARVAGFDYIGCYRYFLTSCTRDRRRSFEDPIAVSETLQAIRAAAVETDMALLAYCFMPDHVHLLVEGTTDHASARAWSIRHSTIRTWDRIAGRFGSWVDAII